ncbi:MSHA biogenesis protein MshF [Vibrio panuliri]|uniref:MSHA biogenesis protein MshF n=1 Tax=Vibrio panuliri TaxID=1381081 RepID=A0A1Q9HC42_9VIBR|nr:MSHA biogenesis protein MshF [Vibrio panuliri]OLQ86963.1 MSHA biogenesis protein MshF [Vibrio panuliri]
MPKQIRRSRFAVWLLLIMILVMAFLLAWQKVEQEASSTALVVAGKRILDRANFYKQEWLLAGQPAQLNVQQKFIHYSAKGWPLPQHQTNKVDCGYWMDLLYQEQRVLGTLPKKINDNSTSSDFQCQYFYGNHEAILIGLVDDKFSVSVSFSSE